MKQEHTEEGILHTDGQQNTGNHPRPGTPESGGADRFGGTRAGAGNVEPAGKNPGKNSVQSGPDVDAVEALDRASPPDLTNQRGTHAERKPERDERGRL